MIKYANLLFAVTFVCALAFELGAPSTAVAQNLRAECIHEVSGQAVVRIVYKFQTSAGDKDEVQGSGFLIRRDGYIITAAHVVRPPAIYTSPVTNAEVEVKVGSFFGQSYQGTVITKNDDLDVALIKMPALAAPWPAVQVDPLQSPEKRVWLYGLGFPAGGDLTGAGPGRITSLNAVLGGKPTQWWNTDVPLNEGMSGGPIFNEFGEVAGIAGAMKDNTGGTISYVIPIALASTLISSAGVSEYVRSPCGDDPRDFILEFIKGALRGEYKRENISDQLWNMIQVQTAGTNKYEVFSALGVPELSLDVLDQKHLEVGTLATVKVTHQNGTSLWFVSYNRLTRQIDASSVTPQLNKQVQQSTPVVVGTYSVCVGEHADACFGHTHLTCGTDVEGWSKVMCRTNYQTVDFEVTKMSDRGGNKCGYAVFDVVCLKK